MKPTRAERKSGKCANFMLYEVVEIPEVPKEIWDLCPSVKGVKSVVWGVKNDIVRVTEDDYMIGTLHPAQYKEEADKE